MADSRSDLDSLAEILKGLPPEQLTAIARFLSDARFSDYIKKVTQDAVSRALPPALEAYSQQVGFSEEVVGLARWLAARSNDSQEGVLKKALTLYAAALDAQEKGNRLAILSPTDEIVHEIVGFEPSEPAPSPVAK